MNIKMKMQMQMYTQLARFLRQTVAAVLVCALCGFAVADERPALTYHSPEVDCHWLDIEYETIKVHTNPNRPKPETVTKAGVMMAFGMALTLPLAIFQSAFGKKRQRRDFSRVPDDIAVAATDKECLALLELMEADKRAGKYPPPLISNVR